MLTNSLIVALFIAFIAMFLLIALTALNLGLYIYEWLARIRSRESKTRVPKI